MIFLTDGRLGSRELLSLSGQQRRQRETAVAATRRQEAECALDVLGVQHWAYWMPQRCNSSPIRPSPASWPKHCNHSNRTWLTCLYFLDEHADHRAVSLILAQAVRHATPQLRLHGLRSYGQRIFRIT